MSSMVSYISLSSFVIVHTAIHINVKTTLIPLNPGLSVKKDLSKTLFSQFSIPKLLSLIVNPGLVS